jgi:MFS family permease
MHLEPRKTGSPSTGTVPAIVTAALLGEYSLLIIPFILTAMMQGYHLSEINGANLVSAQLVAMGVGGIAVSRLLRRVRPKQIVIAAALAIVAANALCPRQW